MIRITYSKDTLRRIYRECLAGDTPAEILPPDLREKLVRELHSRLLTDVEVAAHTGWSTYTAARIRRRLGLPVNFNAWEVA
jgi:hypothetical protein